MSRFSSRRGPLARCAHAARQALLVLAIASTCFALAPRAAAQCTGDLTDSGSVGVADLLELLACWGQGSGSCAGADLTGDGNVGVADLLVLLANWGLCSCAPDCAGKACGDDGCGGSCGECAPGKICVDGGCIAANSCAAAGACGLHLGLCGCDEFCCFVDDCCFDKVAECGGCSPSGPGPDSCIGQCGGNPGNCWCDEDCCIFNDCCDDKHFVCGGCSP